MSSSTNDTDDRFAACRGMLARFFERFPDDSLQSITLGSLEKLLSQHDCCDGKPGGWAGGLVHAITKCVKPGHHVILNSELEEIFGVSIGTIRKRSEQTWCFVGSEVLEMLSGHDQIEPFTLRDEANAMCAFAFRNGPIEDLHASVDSDGHPRISDPEMKHLMVEASGKLAKLLEMKATDPEGYLTFLKNYNRMYCRHWER